MKRCGKCGRVLPETLFSKNKNKKDGLNLWCRDCMFEYYKSKRPSAVQIGARKQMPDNSYLRLLYEDNGRTMESIAKEYGVSFFAIHSKLEKAGTNFRKSSESRAISERLGRIEPQKGKKLSQEQRETSLRSLEKARAVRMETRKHRTVSHGYILIYVGDGRYRFEHDIVVEKMLGRPLAPNECVHHINHRKDDNRAENLCVMDKRDHAIMHQHDLIESGAHHLAKLTRQQAILIKQSSESYNKLAKEYGVSKHAIYSIKKGRTWKDI